MTIYLVRHGLALAGAEDLDPGLAETGHRQAALAADPLAHVNAGRLLVSPLRRTRETAVPIAEALGLDPEIRTEVAEVFDPSMPAGERRAMIGPFMAGAWSEQSPVLKAWRQRVIDAVTDAARSVEAAQRDLVIVSHYIAIGVIIGAATRDDRVVPVPMANASITTVTLKGEGFELVSAAANGHLPPELVTGIHTATMGRA